ncbi:C6 transcription factor [Fusarium albosuccineum]|uniref:C6 transcription factor n=1 Tax=Fusarium albosuccineum TaxID=1237068 RepID=A0A8H4JXQ6_9HYPO|nr:C6 transcription factor [Fusarium albosuccineum]
MSPPRNFLGLPYELRHQVYGHYFALDDGYVLNFDSGKLATANNEPLDLSLMYTCRIIATETKYLPLGLNTISFSTGYHKDWSPWALRFHCLYHAQCLRQVDFLASSAAKVTPDIYSRLGAKFPRFVTVMENFMRKIDADNVELFLADAEVGDIARYVLHYGTTPERWHSQGECLSKMRQAIEYTLKLVAQDGSEELGDQGFATQTDCINLLDRCFEPWAIPSWSDLEARSYEFQDECWWQQFKSHHNDFKFRFSATAVAIRFLRQLPVSHRLSIRKIILDEDHITLGCPERHAQGLIPFCKENPRLRIERRVSLLNNILHSVFFPQMMFKNELDGWAPEDNRTIQTSYLSQLVGSWLVEALAVMDAGMPADAFTFVLDGGPAKEVCSGIFQQTIHRDLAWQTAISQRFPAPPGRRHEEFNLFWDDLPKAMTHLINQTSILRCNFDPGEFWDAELVMDKIRNWRVAKISREFICRRTRYRDGSRDTRSHQMPPAFPSWAELLPENYDWETEGA